MTTRRNAPFSALLALALVCLMPAALSAHTKGHIARKSIVVTRSHKAELHAVADRHHAATKHRKREAEPVAVNHKRSLHREAAPVPQRLTAKHMPAQTPTIPASPSPAPVTREARVTGVSHPPDLDDVAPDSNATSPAPVPASSPPVTNSTPVVNVIRKTTERPQLPSIEEAAVTPEILPTLYNKRGRLIVPPPLKGSREILLHQNEVADRDGLTRVQDDRDLEEMRSRRMLVALPVNAGMQVDERLPSNRRYCRPWTAAFLETLARAHYAHFHTALQVNSAVRTVEFQQRLIRTNGNAAPAEGETASQHLTGQAVDLAKHGLSLSEIAWMRGYLLPLVQEGKIDVEEEFQQACFHISVYKKYLPPASVPRRSIASTRRSATGSLAVAIP